MDGVLGMAEKPSLIVVCEYAKPLVRKFMGKYCPDMPKEQKEEIMQNAYMRLCEAYPNLDADRGWKAFTYLHARGAVLDYMKSGTGFQEDKWSLNEEQLEDGDPKKSQTTVPKMRERIFLSNTDGESIDIDTVLGQSGIYNEMDLNRINIKWDLVARLASENDNLHVFAKWLKGSNLDEISHVFNVSAGRIGQMIKEFIYRLDEGSVTESPTMCQTIYALGLSRYYGIPDSDQSKIYGMAIGTDLAPVDLDSDAPFNINNHTNMDLFD